MHATTPDAQAREQPSRLSSRLTASRQVLMEAMAGLDEEGFRARPDPSEWSAAEVLAHLLDWERLLNRRIERALRASGAHLVPTSDEERDRQAALGRQAPVPQLIHGLLASRRQTELLLQRMRPEDLERSLYHPVRRVNVSVKEMVAKLIAHEEEHAARIRELRHRQAGQTVPLSSTGTGSLRGGEQG